MPIRTKHVDKPAMAALYFRKEVATSFPCEVAFRSVTLVPAVSANTTKSAGAGTISIR